MDAHNIASDFNARSQRLNAYIRDAFPRMAMNKSLRFIDGNFRAQGWQGRIFSPWTKNRTETTILIKTGRLRNSIHGESGPWQARIWTDAPYARVHNRGFNGTVNVKAHTRNAYAAHQRGTGLYDLSGSERLRTIHTVAASTEVKAHTRKMNIPRRQFMPENINDSPVLFNAIRRELIKEIKAIY